MDDQRSAVVCWAAAVCPVAVFSGAINVLMLTGFVVHAAVQDRVGPGRSIPTQVSLISIRGRMLARTGRSLDEALSGHIFEAVVCLALKNARERAGCDRSGTWIQSRRRQRCGASDVCLGGHPRCFAELASIFSMTVGRGSGAEVKMRSSS